MPTASPRPYVDVVERIYTAADVAIMPSDLPSGPVRYELDNGRLITMVPPGDVHGSVEANMTAMLHAAAKQYAGKVRCGEVGVVLWRNPDRLVAADVVYVAKESLPILRSPEGYLETMPDLVVEVRSKNDTQPYLERKIADYLSAGVKQVWLADPASKTLAIHRPHRPPQVLTAADQLLVEDVLPGLQLAIADIFAD